ncbi:hypothetical protein [Allomuricauda sp. CP2A]|jgi:hypothetical protein|uniref:phosphoribosyltransferase-like protein n=1 Tax=Allomuricauda sp. CP2A TaxID=1848189 RepID=UPI00082EB3B9|nr:hypothetical protein [Muricauda sp. CP2A]
MQIIEQIDNVTLEILGSRLKNVVAPLNIIQWLNNFKPSEVQFAIHIAMNMNVFTTYEIESILDKTLNGQFPKLEKGEKILILPVGDFGKSGSMIAYFVQKTNFHGRMKNSNKLKLVAHLDESIFGKDQIYLVLIDDFAGSGKSIETFYNDKVLKYKDRFKEIHFVGIAGMNRAVERIEPLFDKVHFPKSNLFKPLFARDSHNFGYRNYNAYREFCYQYGVTLSRPKILKNGNEKYVHALGFENSQALVSFSHGSPNNTLPIIWANKNGWHPLIPRFSNDKMSVSREFRKSLSYELALLKEFGSNNVKREFFTFQVKRNKGTFNSVGKIDFSVYGIIRLKRAGHTVPTICQKMGMLTSDYEDMMDKAVERRLFTENFELSDYGLQLYYEAKKTIKALNRSIENEESQSFVPNEIKYLPKQFNGRS